MNQFFFLPNVIFCRRYHFFIPKHIHISLQTTNNLWWYLAGKPDENNSLYLRIQAHQFFVGVICKKKRINITRAMVTGFGKLTRSCKILCVRNTPWNKHLQNSNTKISLNYRTYEFWEPNRYANYIYFSSTWKYNSYQRREIQSQCGKTLNNSYKIVSNSSCEEYVKLIFKR